MAVLLQPVNLASVEIPEKLRRQKEEETAAAVTAERKPDGPGEYQPVPPFANVSNTGAPMQTPPGIAPLNVLGTTDTIAEIERRFTHGGELAQNGTK
ncbi:hypothetical protein HK100_009583 [Physocladia obscura]|uniref:Uncharacterized protein n=1 Tax=Physocladia obscura TaxID=109957 RepID=A0AAD5XHX0_9FUNG|nr:hypothetical protein HK100_009583 [Physocladia obscura]